MALTQKDIEHIARLARLELSDEEKERFTAQLSSIVAYVSQVQEVDTTGIEYQYTVPGLANVTAPDVVNTCSETTHDALLVALPDRAGNLLKVKKIFS